MANEFEDQEETQIAEAPQWEEEELPGEEIAPPLEEKTPLRATKSTEWQVASIRDRLSAFFIDVLFLFYLYLGTLFTYRGILWKAPIGFPPVDSPHIYLFNSIVALETFLYFFIGEAVFFTTIGKFCNWMSVRSKDGGVPSLFSVLIRNCFKPFDLLLGFFPTWWLLEKTAYRQKVGDLVSSTVVVKKTGHRPALPVEGFVASASLRVASACIDILFFAGWLGGSALLLDPQRPLMSTLLVATAPLLILFWFLTWELLLGTSPGKWMLGLRYVQEDGEPLSFSSALFRTLARVVDTTPLGWLAVFISERNQRIGDLWAGSVVIHAKRQWKGLIGLVVSLLCIGAFWFVGQANPRNITTPFFSWKFLQVMAPGKPSTKPEAAVLMVTRFKYLNPDRTDRRSSKFSPGETVHFSFELVGFVVRDNEAWIQEDLAVRFPDGTLGYKQENWIDSRKEIKNRYQPIELDNTVTLPASAQPGRYVLLLTLRDKLSNRQLNEQRFFEVTAPSSPGA